jgi:hypothetical protein
MYLKADFYVSGCDHSKDDEKAKYAAVLKAFDLSPTICESTPSLTVSATVAYWRKANAIHKWFVDNVQDGVDECQPSDVSRKQLEELVRLCKEVVSGSELVPARVQNGTLYTKGKVERLMEDGFAVKDPTVAMEKLPTTSGFFFGGIQYDHWYFDDLKSTITQIETLLNNPKFERADFTYRASW